jgi:hypothetical protein
MIKKILLILLFLFGLFTVSVKAAPEKYNFIKSSGVKEIGSSAGYNINNTQTPESYIGTILTIIFSVLGIIFMILTIYAGIKWMTAQGNNSQIDAAKDTITRAIIGLIIVIVAYGITYFIINIFYPSAV